MTRPKMLTIRLTLDEWATLAAAAKRSGLGLGPWLRSLGMREAQAPTPRARADRSTPS